MFEDDIDIDDILDSCESTSSTLKRLNTDFHSEHLSKKPKTSPVAPPGDAIDTSKPSKKIFRFKKKETVQGEDVTDAVKLDVNNKISSLTTHSEKNIVEVDPIETFEERRCLTRERTQKNEVKCDPISNISSGDQAVGKYSNSRIQNETIIKRRFPGPAGLLPDRNLNNCLPESINEYSGIRSKNEIYSQSSFVTFNEEPWDRMMIDFKAEGVSLPEKYNIQWIKSRTAMKKLINQKAPFLAAFVDNIRSHSIQNPIVNLGLKDKTGTIQGTILHNLYEEQSGNLTVGSVVVLKDLGVLNTGPNDEPYLTITRNNLVSIYSNRKKTGDSLTQTSDEISKVSLQNLNANEILNKMNETRRLHKINLKNTFNNIQSISLGNKDIKGPTNMRDTFRKVIHNVKTPNLSVLKIKSTVSDNSVELSENSPSCSKKENEKIQDMLGFFGSQEGIDEFFSDEPNSCSTQIAKNVNNHLDPKPETCSVENQDNSQIFEDMFEGVDANALFDEF